LLDLVRRLVRRL